MGNADYYQRRIAAGGSMRGIFLDTETGGLYPRTHSLLSIAAVAFEVDAQGAWVLDEILIPVKPHPDTCVGEGALKVQGIGWSALGSPERLSEVDALTRLSTWLADYEGFPMFAHNAQFDRDFLSAAISRSGKSLESLKALTGRHAAWVCTIGLANALIAFKCMERPQKGLSLDALAEHLGVQGRTADGHEALEDAQIGVRIVDRLHRIAGWA